jgi:hypothetical protein
MMDIIRPSSSALTDLETCPGFAKSSDPRRAEVDRCYWCDRPASAHKSKLQAAIDGDAIINEDVKIRKPSLADYWQAHGLGVPMPKKQEILAMLTFRENLYIATSEAVYVKGRGDEFHKLKIEE